MSYGPLAGIHFEGNRGGGPGIFWQKEKPKNEPKKFGYKSRKLRHPIRRPDEEAALKTMEEEKEAEKKKFNKGNKNFIQNNKERFKPKDESQMQAPRGTEIKPGTVTLTQEQLAALLASLGKTQNKGGESPMKISIDPTSNKIQVEQYDSDDNGDSTSMGRDERDNRNNYAGDDDDDDDVGIAAFLGGSNKPSKKESKPRERDDDRRKDRDNRSREHNRSNNYRDKSQENQSRELNHVHPSQERPMPQPSREGPSRVQPSTGRQAETRLSLEEAKKEAGVAHVADTVPWKHLTVGERKRMQWARERAELAENYDPWGRPGAGAPPLPKHEPEPPQQQQQPQYQRQPRQQQQPGTSHGRDVMSRNRTESVDPVKTRQQEILENEIEKLQREIREAEERKKKREEAKESEIDREEKKKQEVEEQRRERRTDKNTNKKRSEKKEDQSRDRKERKESEASKDEEQEIDDTAHLSKKELERRKWLAELDKQREEQRMRKQQEKELDRTGIHDQWADRFVYHKSIEQTTPRGQIPQPREEMSVLGKVKEEEENTGYAPPVAMRSALVVGAGTLNENRYDNKKADEKRRWLAELEKQREEQRLAKAAEKERDRQEDGTWADRYPTDHKKLLQTNDILEKTGPTPREPVQSTRLNDGRTRSAPGAPQADIDAEEAPSFLRGQGVFVDPTTRKEQEEKRRIYLEYQAQIKAQIEEKERLKREERERKKREDMEEERKLQMEREAQRNQMDMEQRKIREREEMRQRQINDLKSAMDVAQEQAQEEKHQRRLQKLQEKGHDVAHLKATYDEPPLPMSRMSRMSHMSRRSKLLMGDVPGATSPRRRDYDPSSIPGLGLDTSQDYHLPPSPPPPQVSEETAAARMDARPAASRHVIGQSYTKESHLKEPYVENRVLTPSRFRNPSKPYDDPDSPRREFGTQTLELKDLQEILRRLPDEVQIEYKMKVEEAIKDKTREKQRDRQVPSRKVHPKSADETERTGRVKKPDDNPRLPRKKVVEKEEDPEPKKPTKITERPKWNQNKTKTVKKNSEKDPFYQQRKEEKEQRKAKRERQLQYLQELNQDRIPAMSKSPVRSRDVSPEGKKPVGERGRRPEPRGKQGQGRDESPNILSLINETDRTHRSKSPRPTGRSSPPIPTVRHRTTDRGNDTDRDPYQYANNYLRNSQTETKYGDVDIYPIADGDFLPFMRTTEILDPSKADEPVAISRENSRMERARRAYHDTHNPASKGRKLDVYMDREREAAMKASQDPMLNPSLVTDHPTGRQDRILQQLSSLKQTLMQRQKELETNMSTEE